MKKFLGNFFTNLFAVIAGLFIWSFIAIGFFMGIVGSLSSKNEVAMPVKEQSILHLKLKNPLVESADPKNDPFADLDLDLPFQSVSKTGLIQLSDAIENAKTDEKIKGIYLDLSSIQGGFASLEVIRKALLDFKTSGKFIVAYSESMTEGAYYIASVADEIYLYPLGGLEFNGLSSDVMFYTGMLEKIGVEAKIFRVGKFKSAVEPFFRKDLSEANRKQMESFMNSIYDHYLTKVAEARGTTYDKLKEVSDSMYVRTAEDAVKHGLVTKTAYYDEVEEILRTKSGLEKGKKLNLVSYSKYAKSYIKKVNLDAKDKIAVVIASGQITSGKSSDESMGSETIAKAIRTARLDKDVKAIVLRVNSPGGSALASDVMWREVMLTKESGKPIIASMSDVAASGGYYISMACDKIYAEPNTITGSIGVFGLMFNTQELMNDKLGITFDRVRTGEYSDLGNMNREMTAADSMIIQNSVDQIYLDFTAKAAEGRGMDVQDLRAIASGRVWSGKEGMGNGLVDEEGGLPEAIKKAAEMAKLENYRVKYYPKEKDFFTQLFGDMNAGLKIWFQDEQFGELSPYVRRLKNLENMEGVQVRVPYELDIIE